MVSLLRRPQISKVNARHLLEDLASTYSYSVEEAVLVELIANSLDAKATEISIDLDSRKVTLTVRDNGIGMGADEFESYHDLAESRKVKGRGIGFAGLGAKLGHKVARKVVTETRSDGYRDASDWSLNGNDLEWKHIRSRSLRGDGTRVTLFISPKRRRMMSPNFVRDTIATHYGALLDPFLSEVYIWASIYPEGVTLTVDGEPLPKRPLVPPEAVEHRKETDILNRRKRRVGRAVFVMTSEPLPEDRQGIVISTYGKRIRLDSLGVHPREPDLITGWVEAPDLVECLTLSKQDFIDSGRQGEKYRRIRREIQKAFGDWLDEIGEAREPAQRRRAPRQLERETARIVRRIPQLHYLYGARQRDAANVPDESGDTDSVLTDAAQPSFGIAEGPGGEYGSPPAPGNGDGKAATPEPGGPTKTRARPRTVRGGPPSSACRRLTDRKRAGWLGTPFSSIPATLPMCSRTAGGCSRIMSASPSSMRYARRLPSSQRRNWTCWQAP